MSDLQQLLDNNAAWAERINQEDPEFFNKLSKQQTPEILWIGCSDSRVPANQIVDLLPGELFVHRNIANAVVHTDLNCLSVIYYATRVLGVKHIIVCGHYGCGGVNAALTNQHAGLTDHWVRNIRDVYFNKRKIVDAITDEKERLNRLCELNVEQQVANVSHIHTIQEIWAEDTELTIHGWIYDIQDGRIKQVTEPVNNIDQVAEQYVVNLG